MKKLVAAISMLILVLSVLLGFSGCKGSPKCAHCDAYVVPMHRILNGGEDFYLCGDCCAVGLEFGVIYYKIKGSCYFCRNEAVCNLFRVDGLDDEYTSYAIVCDDCDAYKEEHGRWPE